MKPERDNTVCYATYDNPNTMRREWWVKYRGKKELVKSFCGMALDGLNHAFRNEPCDDETWFPSFKEGLIQGDKDAIGVNVDISSFKTK